MHQAALRQRAAGSLSLACLKTLASRSASSRRALHVTAAAATETREETFTYQAEVGVQHPHEPISCMDRHLLNKPMLALLWLVHWQM